MNRRLLLSLCAVALFLSWGAAGAAGDYPPRGPAGAVYAMTNAADDNQVVIFDRDGDGALTPAGAVSTTGTGSGGGLDPLASQGSLVLTADNRWLLAVNAGSNDVSVFRVRRGGLTLVDKVPSGGESPVSIAVSRNLVYVLNVGGTPNIAGFYLGRRGQLTPRPHATRTLGAGGFAQVGFDPRGDNLVITGRDQNEILVFPLGRLGLPAPQPVTSTSNGIAPFGFIFDPIGNLLVAEAGSGAVSYYGIADDGSLEVISPSVENGQAATCWIAGNERGYVFTANTGSQTISAYTLVAGKGKRGKDGRRHRGFERVLELLDATAGAGNRPIDMDISADGRFLYALDPAAGSVDAFAIEPDGSLTDLGAVGGGFAIFAQGIAAR